MGIFEKDVLWNTAEACIYRLVKYSFIYIELIYESNFSLFFY